MVRFAAWSKIYTHDLFPTNNSLSVKTNNIKKKGENKNKQWRDIKHFRQAKYIQKGPPQNNWGAFLKMIFEPYS